MSGRQKKKSMIQGFQVVEEECIWMKAGVVNFRLCDNAYDCTHCAFDQGMRRLMETGSSRRETKYWGEALKERYPGWERPCRHALTGRIDAPKICTRNYECYHCPYDQMMDQYTMSLLTDPPKTVRVSGYELAEGYYFHPGHCWVRFEPGGMVRVGFDDFLLRVFGTPNEVELPPLGRACRQNETGCSFRRDGREADTAMPVSGTVVAVNHEVLEHPETARRDPYHAGWLLMLEPEEPKKATKSLYFGREAAQWLEMENQKLMRMMGPEYESLAATGGQPVDDMYGRVPGLDWNELVRSFLRTAE